MKRLRKILINIVFVLFFFMLFSVKVKATCANVYIFYGKTCPHCHEALKYLDSIKRKYDLNIYKYEVWQNQENKKVMNTVATLLDVNVRGVPFVVIDNTPIFGYKSEVTDEIYRYHIKQASKDDFVDKVGIKLGIVKEKTNQKNNSETKKVTNYLIKIPIIGKLNLKNIPLLVLSILIGIIDGFNPCGMWVLLFLISALIGMKDKKKLWTLGLTFLIVSSFIYMAFMVLWLSFSKMVSGVSIVRTIIAIAAIIGACVNLNIFANSLYSSDDGKAIDAKKRKKILSKINKFIHEKSFIISIIGVIFLAFSVNLIELACSQQLPIIFTQILSMNDLSTFEYFSYIIIYIFFFMLVHLIIFLIAVKMLQLIGISTKHNRYSNLISGMLMLIIGFLLMVKPEWLMFNF